MPSSLHKVQKTISKKRLNNKKKSNSLTALHEDSRDAKRIRRAAARDDKVIRQSHLRDKRNDKFLNRLAYFHGAIKVAGLIPEEQYTTALSRTPNDDTHQSGNATPLAPAVTPAEADVNMEGQLPSSHTLTPEEISHQNATATTLHAHIALFLSRNDSRIASLDAERRKGRPKSTEQIREEQDRDVEKSEYESGFWMPDLREEVDRRRFREWDGKWEGLGPFKFVRVRRKREGEEARFTVSEARFPPGGSS